MEDVYRKRSPFSLNIYNGFLITSLFYLFIYLLWGLKVKEAESDFRPHMINLKVESCNCPECLSWTTYASGWTVSRFRETTPWARGTLWIRRCENDQISHMANIAFMTREKPFVYIFFPGFYNVLGWGNVRSCFKLGLMASKLQVLLLPKLHSLNANTFSFKMINFFFFAGVWGWKVCFL